MLPRSIADNPTVHEPAGTYHVSGVAGVSDGIVSTCSASLASAAAASIGIFSTSQDP
jgi:hypothetical protein